MKLLYCPDCRDLFKLTGGQRRQCKCGNVKGRYLDKKHAEISPNAISVVIGNGSLRDAIERMKWWEEHRPVSSRGDYKVFSGVTAWVRPNFGPGNPRSRRIGVNHGSAYRKRT